MWCTVPLVDDQKPFMHAVKEFDVLKVRELQLAVQRLDVSEEQMSDHLSSEEENDQEDVHDEELEIQILLVDHMHIKEGRKGKEESIEGHLTYAVCGEAKKEK